MNMSETTSKASWFRTKKDGLNAEEPFLNALKLQISESKLQYFASPRDTVKAPDYIEVVSIPVLKTEKHVCDAENHCSKWSLSDKN